MNNEEFNKWIKKRLYHHLIKDRALLWTMRPIIIFDDEDKIPKRKNEIRDWLSKNRVGFSSSMLRPELLKLAKAHKKTKKFHIDKYLESKGHACLRLPPYHPQLNPIELVWAEIKLRWL